MPGVSRSSNEIPARGNVCEKCLPSRYIVVIFGLIALFVVYGIQLDLSIPSGTKNFFAKAKSRKGSLIKDIVKLIPTLNNDTCRTFTTTGVENAVGFSEPLQGTLLSSYLIGYIISQIPAAYLSEHSCAKGVMIISIFIHFVCVLLTGIADQLHCSLMTIIRVGEGIAGGMMFPTIHVLLANWAPSNELNRMSCLIYSGTSLGIIFSILSNGFTLALGTVTFLWIFGCAYFIRDTPDDQPFIGVSERNYINSTSRVSDRSSVSLTEVITSLPFIAILVTHICFNWGWYTILIGTSSYLEQVFDFNIKKNAIASVPLFTMWIFSVLIGKIFDAFCESEMMTTTMARKVATFIASVVPMICLLSLCFIKYSLGITGTILGIAVTALGGMYCGFFVNHIDIAPHYAGTLMAITNTVATIPGIILPFFISEMTNGNQTIDSWRIIFFVAIAFYSVGIIVYVLFGSGEEERWSNSNSFQLNHFGGRNDERSPFRGQEPKSYYYK